MNEFLDKIRSIRTLQDPKLKPSPYLKSEYMDDYGDTRPVCLRPYQVQGVMNMLVSEQFILGDDCGLGKTLEVLSVISYILLKEPEYVPIILTKKSALYQWSAEVDKFLTGISTVTVDGEPYERHQKYEEFFYNHDPDKKQLLILTYDMLLRDMSDAVIRDKTQKASSADKKKLKEINQELAALESKYDVDKNIFSAKFNERFYEVHMYLRSRLSTPPTECNVPSDWTQEDEREVVQILKTREQVHALREMQKQYRDQISPPKVAPGIKTYLEKLQQGHPNAKFMLVMDEMHVLKNYRGKIHASAAELAKCCQRLCGMTATPVKNRLMEFFALFRIIVPKLFPKVTQFMNEFCVTKLQPIGGGRKIPIVVGYRNLDEFVRRIEPYYLSRRKHEVAKELPQLVTRELVCELTDLQEELYDLAENGLLTTGGDVDSDQTEVLKALTYVQQAANSPHLITNEETGEPYEGDSSKINAITELLSDELDGIKTIIFSKYEKMISLIEKELNKNKIKCVRITGKENPTEREKAKNTFQNSKSDVNVILITMAGSESINLQSAEHFIMVDSPWSAGDYLQLIGRMIRIGSAHQTVIVTHLVAYKQGSGKTIDHHVLKILKQKKKLMDKVSGDGLQGGLQFDQNEAHELFNAIYSEHETQKPKKPRSSKKSNLLHANPEENRISCINLDDI